MCAESLTRPDYVEFRLDAKSNEIEFFDSDGNKKGDGDLYVNRGAVIKFYCRTHHFGICISNSIEMYRRGRSPFDKTVDLRGPDRILSIRIDPNAGSGDHKYYAFVLTEGGVIQTPDPRIIIR